MSNSLVAKATSSGNYEPAPSGNHVAICYSMVWLGTQTDEYQGKMIANEKVKLTWELPEEKRDVEGEELPYSISMTYTFSLNEKAKLKSHLESWRGKSFTQEELNGFDLTKVLGAPCLLNVVHKTSKSSGNVYATVTGISPLAKGMKKPEMINPAFIFSPEDIKDAEKLERLTKYDRETLEKSPEFRKSIGQPDELSGAEDNNVPEEDDLPF